MNRYIYYPSPLGTILLMADQDSLLGLWFEGQKYFPMLGDDSVNLTNPVLEETVAWLDGYFSGRVPKELPRLHLVGSAFQLRVWKVLLTIPYGQTRTYGDLAKQLGVNSAQAIGGAVGRNPVSILVPCHRVVGAGGSLTGYAGGLDRKRALLQWEQEKRTIG